MKVEPFDQSEYQRARAYAHEVVQEMERNGTPVLRQSLGAYERNREHYGALAEVLPDADPDQAQMRAYHDECLGFRDHLTEYFAQADAQALAERMDQADPTQVMRREPPAQEDEHEGLST